MSGHRAADPPLFPGCEVELLGRDGNAFAIVAHVSAELRRYLRSLGTDPEIINEEVNDFRREAMSGDYEHLLATCELWVTVR